ncbi:MAG: tetratricopeptide repeat protein [Gemmataceae bacterium]
MEKLKVVREVLRTVDPNPYRDAVRDAILTDNTKKITALADQSEAATQPPRFIAFFVSYSAIPVERRHELLVIALQREPGDLSVLLELGDICFHYSQYGPREGLRWFQAAVGIAPGKAQPHVGLGWALQDTGDLDGAIVECKEALRIAPTYAHAHVFLGRALLAKGDLDGAIAECKEAIRLAPMYTPSHLGLGKVLANKGDLDGAIAKYKEAIQLDPSFSYSHNGLGWALQLKGDLDGAIAALTTGIRLDPKKANAHHDLGWVLQLKGDLDGAVAAYKEALRLDPKYAPALSNLPKAERMRELLSRLPDVLAGKTAPKDPVEACAFASLWAQPFQKRYAAAVRLYEKAFADNPKLADDLVVGHRYDAACCAALAETGRAVDAADLKPTERSALRGKALDWLRADLALRRKQATSADPAERKLVAGALAHWLQDTDLTGTRPVANRQGWSSEEVAAWDKLWADVRATLAEARQPSSAIKSPKP